MRFSRREFLSAAAATGIVTKGSPALSAATEAVTPKAHPFPLTHVRVTAGPLHAAMERNREYLHALEPDRLLHTFRLNAGLPTSAQPLGGWEGPSIEVRGHFTGHYLSACALMYSATGDTTLRDRANSIVEDLAKCQRASGGLYLSAFPTEFFDRLKNLQKVWAPWYTLHKIMAGMYDVHTHCGNGQALEVLQGMANWAGKWASDISDERMAKVLNTEFGGMNDVLYNLYSVTGAVEHQKLAHRFDHEQIFAPLAGRRDELKGLHANTNIPKITGAARRYELTGEQRYRDIAEFFWRQLVDHRSYCTGGNSNREHWRTPPDALAAELSKETEECCCTYNMLKLTRHLFGWSPEARYADFYERAFLNGIQGTMSPETAGTQYFVPLAAGFWKLFGSPRDSFWCCTGTGVETFSKVADSIYFHDDRGLWVNLFLPSELDWKEKGLRIAQITRMPEEDETTLEIKSGSAAAELRIRVPYWASSGASIKVNGNPVKVTATPSSYASINRTWRAGDKVQVKLPMSLHAHPMPDDPSIQAFVYGPVVLAGRMGTDDTVKAQTYSGQEHICQGDATPAPEFEAPAKLEAWIKPGDKPVTFRTDGQRQNVVLVPLNSLFGERYGVYWKVNRKG